MVKLYLNGKLFSGSEEEFLAIDKYYSKTWTIDGKIHRDGYPAEFYSDGSIEIWYQNNKTHRKDGPAYSAFHLRKMIWYLDDLEYHDFFDQFFPMKNFIKNKVPGEQHETVVSRQMEVQC